MSLFRPEALANKQTTWLGTIVLIRPLSFALLTLFSVVIATSVVLFFGIGEYTKKARVTGQLVPEMGVVKLVSREGAIVRENRVREGQQVKRGAVLFVLAPDRISATGADANAITTSELALRRTTLETELAAGEALRREQSLAVVRRTTEIAQQATQIDAELATQAERVRLADTALKRTADLVAKGFVSASQLEQKEAEKLNELARLQSLDRNRLMMRREIAALEQEGRELPAKAVRERTALERALGNLRQEAGDHGARSEYVVRAPEDGTITALQTDVGHTVAGNAVLASLVPAGSNLHAALYAPSRAIGFVDAGRDVLLRYQAFPYQKFGQQSGKVISVSKTALPVNEVPVGVGDQTREPLYRIVVALDSQTIEAYGKPQSLLAGMQVEADVQLDRRRLIEWVFEPLFSLSKKA